MLKQPCQPRTAFPAVTEPANQDQSELVRLIAWQIYARVPRHASVEVADVIQAGHLGLLRARRSYRSESDVPFPVYARYRIRGEILDMLRRLDSAPRSLRRLQRAIESQTRSLSIRLQRHPTDEELSETLGVELAKVRRHRQALAATGRDHVPTTRPGEDTRSRLCESAAAPEGMPDVIQERKESIEILLRSIAGLNPKARSVVLLYYRQNLTMKQIGTILQVNESRVSQIHKHALQTISDELHSAGIASTPGGKTK
jgi:RNA polymerase sigma factor for flagellar operon FliA